jgi:hypothetical protein
VVRTIPITKELPFDERWQVPAPDAMPPTIGLANRYQDDFSSNLTSRFRRVPSATIQSAVAVAATFTLVEFCHGGASDRQDTIRFTRPRD